MGNRIELLDTSLIENREKLALIDRWKKVLDLEIGWHYDLDIIWALREVERLGLKKGALVMDAGAGNGLLQFLLAVSGYNVLSVDFAGRKAPPAAKRIFEMEEEEHDIGATGNPYRHFIKHNRGGIDARKVARWLRSPFKAAGAASRKALRLVDPDLISEALSSRKRSYGRVRYVKGDFTDLKNIESGSVDCIVSISALEHNGFEAIRKSVTEFTRVLKKGSAMAITISAARDADWYFKPCEGWCLSAGTIRDLFGMGDCPSNFERYDELFTKLKRSREIEARISRHYKMSGENGLPWGVYDPKYQPVGVFKRKGP
ncbi:MAG: methyltransferase domain-containing protein [Candidatus Methylomirabilis sp.]|nr:methyltransferase domain-containing protein [Deltaproteobacteria bacterium]